jgi:hypothetical protein
MSKVSAKLMRDILTYQTFADRCFDKTTKGKSVPVLRSLRHAPQELVLQGTITPVKAKPTASDIDDLCDLFDKKAKVTPSKKKLSRSNDKWTGGGKASNEENVSPINVIKEGGLFDGLVIVPKASGGIDAIGLSPTKRSKLEMKAESLAKATAWSDARASNKTAVKEADCAQVNFSKALKAISNAKSTRFTETKEAARISTRRSAKRGMN